METTKNNYRVNVEFVNEGKNVYTHSTIFNGLKDAENFAQTQTKELETCGLRYFITILFVDPTYKTVNAVKLYN